jgi:hypothetical protein
VTVKPQGLVTPITTATSLKPAPGTPQRTPDSPASSAPHQPGPAQPGAGAAGKDAWWDNAYQSGRRAGGQYPPSQSGPASYSQPTRAGQPGQWPSGSGTLEQPSFPHDEYPQGTGGKGARPGGSRRGGRRVLLALLVLVVVAAGAVAGTMLLKHGTGASPGSSPTRPGVTTSPVSSTGPVPPITKNTPPVVTAINHQVNAVPAGFTQVTFSPSQTRTLAGFTIDYPKSWQVQQDQQNPQRVTFTDPDGDGSTVEVDLTPHQFPNDMLKEAQYIKSSAQAKGSFTSNYKEFELDAQDIRGTRGGVWRFDYDNAKGVTIRADDLLFVLPAAKGAQSYAIFATAPEGTNSTFWNHDMLPILEKMLQTFEPTT